MTKAQKYILIFAMGFPTVAAWAYFSLFTGPGIVQSLYSASKLLQFTLPVLAIFGLQRRRLRFKLPAVREIFWGAVAGLILGGTLVVTFQILKNFSFIGEVAPLIREKLIAFNVETPKKFFVLAVAISVVHSFLEEYYWRWYVNKELEQVLGPWTAALLSSLAFTGHHILIIKAYLPPDIAQIGIFVFPAFVFIAGLLWAIIFSKTRSLYITWISHLFADAAIFWIGYQLLW